jgi:hypothetical protein
MEDPHEDSFNPLYRNFKKVKRRVKNLNMPELRLSLFFLLIFSFNCITNAEELASTADLNFGSKFFGHTALTKPDVDFDSTDVSVFGNVDSLFGEIQPRLLPDNMSFMEKFLWGEGGLIRKIGLVAPLSPEEREYELSIRRTMLTTHQMLGFATLALMLTADYFGQQVIDGNRHLGDTHQSFVTATIVSYSLTGLLAILSPPPLIRRDEASTTTIHKTLAWIHVAGMILTPILGSMIGGRRHFNINKAHYHQIAGYITTAVFASAMIVVTF